MKRLLIFLVSALLTGIALADSQPQQYCADLSGSWRFNVPWQQPGGGTVTLSGTGSCTLSAGNNVETLAGVTSQ